MNANLINIARDLGFKEDEHGLELRMSVVDALKMLGVDGARPAWGAYLDWAEPQAQDDASQLGLNITKAVIYAQAFKTVESFVALMDAAGHANQLGHGNLDAQLRYFIDLKRVYNPKAYDAAKERYDKEWSILEG